MKLPSMVIAALAGSAGATTLRTNPSPLEATTRRTPFGMVHRDCILQLPSHSTVAELPNSAGVTIKFPNGTVETRLPCASEPAANYDAYIASRRGGAAGVPLPAIGSGAQPAIWEGWPWHYWFGAGFSSTTRPPLQGYILSLNATWPVPARPVNTKGNSSDPAGWGHNEPTLSVWPGVQGGAVLQPVLEFNGLQHSDFSFESWNCCPAGYVVHSDIMTGMKEGDTLVGIIQQPSSDDKVFEITSTWIPAGGQPQSVVLKADMNGVNGWNPQWAEVIIEGYSVTTCEQLSCGVMGQFTDIKMATTVAPNGANISWTAPFYEIDGGRQNASQCRGTTTVLASDAVNIAYDCKAPH